MNCIRYHGAVDGSLYTLRVVFELLHMSVAAYAICVLRVLIGAAIQHMLLCAKVIIIMSLVFIGPTKCSMRTQTNYVQNQAQRPGVFEYYFITGVIGCIASLSSAVATNSCSRQYT
jgi:hypothetical protein